MTTMSSEAVAEKRLLAAVVAQAIRDACMAPNVGAKKKLHLRVEAASAMSFLFNTSRSGVDAYALWLDFDADRFREKLLKRCNTEGHDPQLSDEQKRNFRRNYRLYAELK